MKIGILTSSRADYGIYLPLLKMLKLKKEHHVSLIVFGTHLSKLHGYTLQYIIKDGFTPKYKINTVPKGDSPFHIAESIGNTIKIFASFWRTNKNKFDLIFCLGDRYEMFGAVCAGIPFNIKFAHIHGGETTLGAIDNYFRNAISLASSYHFTSHIEYSHRLSLLLGYSKNIFTVGALSLDNFKNEKLYSLDELNKLFKINLTTSTALITIHPETINTEDNLKNIDITFAALKQTNTPAIICLPNADTHGMKMRKLIFDYCKLNYQWQPIEHFGTKGYFSAMKHCGFMIGNTSSGIIEAGLFSTAVINLGNRQEGRITGKNVITIPFSKTILCKEIQKLKRNKSTKELNIYWKGGAAKKIISTLSKLK